MSKDLNNHLSIYGYIYIAVFKFKTLFLNPIGLFTSYCNTSKLRIVDVITYKIGL